MTAFRDLAVEARVSRRGDDHARVVGLTREPEALYLGDFEAHDGGSGWAVETRESLAAMRRSLLTDAAESAVELSWMRDAIDLAESAVTADPYSERAYRSLMRALAGLGETDRALRVFGDLRTVLADELGVTPSRQTTALQMSILSAPDRDDVVPSWVGRDDDCSAVSELVRRSVNAHRVGLVCVVGDAGSGREALIDESMNRGRSPVHTYTGTGRGTCRPSPRWSAQHGVLRSRCSPRWTGTTTRTSQTWSTRSPPSTRPPTSRSWSPSRRATSIPS